MSLLINFVLEFMDAARFPMKSRRNTFLLGLFDGSDREVKMKHFDDGVHSTVRQFVIHHCPKHYYKSVVCIQMEYVSDDGNSLWSDKHGYPSFTIKKDTVSP